MVLSIVLAAALGQVEVTEPHADAVSGVRQMEIAGEVGVFASGVPVSAALAAIPSVLVGARARLFVPTLPTPLSHVLLEASVDGDIAFGTDSGNSVVATARLGAGFPTWHAALGVWANFCLRCSANYSSLAQLPSFPAHLAPSFTFHWQPEFWGFSVGIFDEAMAMVGHVDLRLGDWAIGYSFPVGGYLAYERRLLTNLGLSVRGFGFSALGAYQAGVMVGLSWLPI
jgi:hypothetical protein